MVLKMLQLPMKIWKVPLTLEIIRKRENDEEKFFLVKMKMVTSVLVKDVVYGVLVTTLRCW